jgi:uncharacterized membrane protein YoaT (DUF817 family)
MKKKHNAFTEHYLIPAVLFLLNICLVHFIYAFVAGSTYSNVSKMALAVAFVFLGSSLLFKRQVLLASSMLFYSLVVLLG